MSVEDSPFCSSKTATRVQVREGDSHRVEIVAQETRTTVVVGYVEGPAGESIPGALVQVSDGGEYLITSHPWADMDGTDCAVTDQDGVARVGIETGSELSRIEVLASGLIGTFGQPEADPDFDFGGEGEDSIEWPGLRGTEFTVRLGTNLRPAHSVGAASVDTDLGDLADAEQAEDPPEEHALYRSQAHLLRSLAPSFARRTPRVGE